MPCLTWRSREKLGDQGQELGAHSELLITHTTCFFGSSTHTACFFGSSTHTACIFIGEHAVFGSGQTYHTMPGLVAVHSLTCTNHLSFLENTHCLHSRQPSPFLPSIVSFQIAGCSYNLNICNHRCQTPRSCCPGHAAG